MITSVSADKIEVPREEDPRLDLQFASGEADRGRRSP